jgi:SAM-dependent methyltransferase
MTNTAQVEYWNAAAGLTWARFQESLDAQVSPLGEAAMAALAVEPGERVLDIGCGCGQTSLQLAERVGPSGAVLGADISAPMLAIARGRGAPSQVRFAELDVQEGDFGEQKFDAAFSRFGVMFFSDPVAAFANVLGALKPGGRLGFVCWRPLAENIWMRAPMEAARELLPESPPGDPHAPGPFAFADAARVRELLWQAGFTAIGVVPHEAEIGGLDAAAALDLALRVGPLGSVLRENPTLVSRAAALVAPVLARYATPDGVRMPAAVWIATAQRP